MFSLSKLEVTLAGSLAIVLLLGGLVLYGQHREAVKQQTEWSAAVQKKKAELAQAKQAGQTLTKQLADAKAKTQVVYKTIVHYIPKQEIVYVNQKPVQSGPITLSLNDLFVFNSSTQGSVSLPSAAFGVAGSSADSGVTLQALFGNYAANAAICRDNANQLQALIDWELAAHGQHP